jgi:hypothetical protein
VKDTSTSFSAASLDEVFSKMDPFACKLITDDDKECGRFPIPIIRIVFLLSGNEASFRQYTPSAKPTSPPLFTSYDYVCAGFDPAFLRPIEDAALKSWERLVNGRNPETEYGKVEHDMLREQLPAGGSDGEYYSSWTDF